MPDKKISQLTSLAQGDIATTTDVLAIVDTSATETKKATPAAIVGAAAAAGLTNVDINSGAIDGTTIGANSAAAGTFTNLTASGTVSFSGATVSNGGSVTTVDINGGTIDGASVGASSASSGAFTTLSASGSVTLSGGTANGVLYLNGSKVATSGSALTFDGTNLGVGVTLSAWKSGARAIQSGANGYLSLWEQTNGSTNLGFGVYESASNTFAYRTTGDAPALYSQLSGQHIWSNAASGTANATFSFTELMRLTSTGLGIGTSSPAAKLDVAGTVRSNNALAFEMTGSASLRQTASGGAMYFDVGGGGSHGEFIWRSSSSFTTRMTLDSSGNLGLGVTPSASNYPTIQVYSGGSYNGLGTGAQIAGNAYFDATANWKYIGSGKSARIDINNGDSGGILFNVASSSGTAGGTISFTQAMTLDASGNLGVGTTSPAFALGSGLEVERAGIATLRLENSSGSNGIEIAADSTTNGIRFYGLNNAPFVFAPNATERARITAAGAFGLGTSSPNKVGWDSNAQVITVWGTRRGAIELGADSPDNNDQCGNVSFMSGSTQKAQIQCRLDGSGNGSLVFYANSATERARITAGGKFLLNTTSTVVSGDEIFGAIGDNGIGVKCTGGSTFFAAGLWNNANSGDNLLVNFYTETGGTNRGSITYNRTAGLIAYNTTSDIRLKENIADAEEAGGKIDAMQVRQFDWKETGNHLDYGFVAQELHAVAPHAVSKPEDDDKMWSVDYSKLVPMLVKEIQSLRARVAQLESN